MPSYVAWLDHSEKERRRALDVISLFRDQGTVDELGLGLIRDTIADALFPGTSTLETRAGYFLFVPWMYRLLEGRRTSSAQIAKKARAMEVQLIDVLADSDDKAGTIGIDARASLKRLPSNVYWRGLLNWGIRIYPGTQPDYHRSRDRFYAAVLTAARTRTDDGDSAFGAVPRTWHPGLPDPPPGFPQHVSFKLGRNEAAYLRDRVLARIPDSLLAFLVDRGKGSATVPYVWEHPQLGEFSASVRKLVEQARLFSLSMNGAALLYNLMMAEARHDDDRATDYRQRFDAWQASIQAQANPVLAWDLQPFWDVVRSIGGRVSLPTQMFVQGWVEQARIAAAGQSIVSSTKARRLIEDRERAVKRGLARLQNRRALELWGGASGVEPLGYRWGVANRIITDIRQGLHSRA
jgi:Family of unknown function (DUF6361)